jgi:acyl-CoA thioester hydrolase
MTLCCEIPLRYGDVDRQGHVNNSVVLQIVESARLVLWARAGLGANPGQVIRRQSIDYLRPISADHTSVRVEHECATIGNTSYGLRFRVSSTDGTLFCEGSILMVAVDGHGAPHPIPVTLKRELVALLVDV